MIENNDFVAGKQKVCSDQELEYSIKFDPPVYRQRYGRIFDTLIDERWRTKLNILCDFGCGELSFFIFVKSLNQLNHIYFVDIDEELLKENIRKVHPLTIEYIRRRTDPLQISVFAGSVADPDYHIFNVDVVTAIELIEHLYPDTLEAFPYNIFYYIQPKIVIITTPNFDFNVLFSRTKRFRHPDHKFEWTRKQFEDWANNIICRFPDYVVSFSGIGEGPDGTKHLGECSQMAVFIRKDTLDDQYILKKFSDNNCNCNLDAACKEQIGHYTEKCSCVCQCCCPNFSWGICRYNTKSKVIDIEKDGHKRSAYYKLIGQVNFPFEQDNRTEDEKMFDEFRYRIAAMGQVYGRFFVEDRERSEIPLNDLLYGNYGGYITKLELLKLLEKNNYRIEECVIEETGQSELCVIYFPMDKLTSSSEESSDFDEDDSVCYNKVEDTVSQWNDSQSDIESINEDSKNNKDLIESRETNEKTKDIIPNTQLDTGSTTPGSNVPPKGNFDV